MPAILAYAKKSGKKKVSSKLVNLDETGEESTELISKLCVIIMWHSYCTEKCLFWYLPADVTSRQVVALRVLGECLGKGEPSLCYLYEEYMVRGLHCVYGQIYLYLVSYVTLHSSVYSSIHYAGNAVHAGSLLYTTCKESADNCSCD